MLSAPCTYTAWQNPVGVVLVLCSLQLCCNAGPARGGVRLEDRLEADAAQPYSHKRDKESEVWALARELPFEVAQRATCSKMSPNRMQGAAVALGGSKSRTGGQECPISAMQRQGVHFQSEACRRGSGFDEGA